MISCNVVGRASGPRFPVGRELGISYGGQFAYVGPFLLSLDESPVDQFDLQVGRLIEGTKTYGSLRDHDVYHRNVSGSLTIQRDIVTGPENLIIRGSFDWGVEFSESTVYSLLNTDHIFTTYVLFEGDFVLVFTNRQSCIWDPNISNSGVPGFVAAYYDFYHRSNGMLYRIRSNTYTVEPSPGFGEAQLHGIAGHEWLGGYQITSVSCSVSPAGIGDTDAIREYVQYQLSTFAPSIVGDEPIDWGDLFSECADQLNYVDSNVLMLVIDIDEWGKIAQNWQSIRKLPGWKKAYRLLTHLTARNGFVDVVKQFAHILKPFASSILFQKYAIATTVSDLDRVREGLVKFINERSSRRLHSRRVVDLASPGANFHRYTGVATAIVGHYPDGVLGFLQETIGKLKHWGIYPEAANLYDLIPYSFVVDWFVDFGGLVESCDKYLNMKNYFPVEYCMMSSKWEAGYASALLLPDLPSVAGDVVFSHYVRWISRELPLPDVALKWGSGPVGHGIESGALLLQRLK